MDVVGFLLLITINKLYTTYSKQVFICLKIIVLSEYYILTKFIKIRGLDHELFNPLNIYIDFVNKRNKHLFHLFIDYISTLPQNKHLWIKWLCLNDRTQISRGPGSKIKKRVYTVAIQFLEDKSHYLFRVLINRAFSLPFLSCSHNRHWWPLWVSRALKPQEPLSPMDDSYKNIATSNLLGSVPVSSSFPFLK